MFFVSFPIESSFECGHSLMGLEECILGTTIQPGISRPTSQWPSPPARGFPHCPEGEVVGSGSPECGHHQGTPYVQYEDPIVRSSLEGADSAQEAGLPHIAPNFRKAIASPSTPRKPLAPEQKGGPLMIGTAGAEGQGFLSALSWAGR